MSFDNPYFNADLSQYRSGNCDVMALALHRLTCLPLGLWGAPFQDGLCEEGEYCHEYVHAVVVVDADRLVTMDAWGPSEGVPENLYFSIAKPELATLYVVSEEEIRGAFTSFDIDEDLIQGAMDLVLHAPWISPFLEDESRSLRPRASR